MTIIINDLTPGIMVSDLIDRASLLMNDEDKARWTEDERIKWINDAARAIVVRRPGARSVTLLLELAAGTYQTAPEGATQLLDVIRNVNEDGSPGRIIRICDRQALDDADPDWHLATPGATQNYTVDERSPTNFYVYPPAVEGATVDVLVGQVPPVVTGPEQILEMREEFIEPIINFMLYRCHTKDSEYAMGAVAAQHYQAFNDAIGTPAQVAQQNSASGNSP